MVLWPAPEFLCIVRRVNGAVRPNGSLGIFRKDSAQHSTAGAAASLQPPSEGAVLRFIYLGGPIGRPFYWELFATFPLTNDESISTLFRVEKDSIYFGMVLSAPWLTQTADQ
jgi:hypothetical protein